MGRRRRKIVKKRVVKPPPKVFFCPLCNENAVAVYHEEGSDYAEVICSSCKAHVKVRWLPSYMSVDAYAEFYDIVTGAKKPLEMEVASGGGSSELGEGGFENASEDRESGEIPDR